MSLSKQTQYAAMGERPPQPTSPAKLPQIRHRLLRNRPRQEDDENNTEGGEVTEGGEEDQNTEEGDDPEEPKTTEVCAYYSFNGEDGTADGWVEMQCEGGCTTSGDIFGCRENLAKTCNECDINSSEGASCCATDFPRCVTAVLEDGDNELTAWRCAATFSGRHTLFSDTTELTTEVTTEDGETRTVTNTATDNTAEGSAGDEGGQPTAIGGGGNSDDNDGGSGGSSTPIGAIVGGVIGGVALILLIAFGIWFIRFQKRKAAAKQEASMEPYRQDPSQTAYAGAGASTYGAPSQYAPSMNPPYAGSPPPGQPGSMAYGGQEMQQNPAMYGYYGHSPKPDQMQGQQFVAEMPQYGSNDPTEASELPAGPQK